MKRNLNSMPGQISLIGIFIIAASLILPGCTKNFEKYNTNPTALSAAQTVAIAATAFGPMEQSIYSNYQIAQNLSADAYAGYMMSPTNFRGGINNLNYALVDGWNVTGFNDQYRLVMAPVSKIAQAGTRTKAPDVWAVALLIQIEAMDRVTDRFGPIPYTKAGSSLTSIPYDDQQTVYQSFFKQIDTAVANLQAFIGNPANTVGGALKNPIGTGDLIYSGDYKKWQKFANSLRLRLAMRIVKADPATAQQQAEKALSDPAGLLATPGDDAAVAQTGSRSNDLWVVTISYNGDNHLNAAMGSYLTGFKDPRSPIYSVPATDGSYTGIRLGVDVTKGNYKGLASYNCVSTFGQTAPQLIMTAAEMWFLKSEAAVRGWAGAGNAQTDYETGINTSMSQWGVSAGAYLSDATSKQVNYVDPINSANNATALSNITIKWDPSATNEQKLERIITQKWIAIFPDGQEAWADYRRTGYPKLFPVAQNFSTNPVIDATIQIRRLQYPSTEYQTNAAAVANGVKLLGGTGDNGNSRLWWDVAKGNF